jgi:hypothetical protein
LPSTRQSTVISPNIVKGQTSPVKTFINKRAQV